MQFTSGTTGNPKAAMLTHYQSSNIINNGTFSGDRMNLSTCDIICSPPPLFHCFGLVLGVLASVTHASTLILPSPTFSASATVDCVVKYHCTALHGVPTMMIAVLDEHTKRGSPPVKLRTGIVAGASVPADVITRLQARFGYEEYINIYGMTESAPATFTLTTNDPLQSKLTSVGKILPHTSAKVVDVDGKVVARGVRGELCVSGYMLQKGYYNNPAKTAEVMIEEEGTLWLHTGDEAILDAEGYCYVTGRIKDMIIRAGENIYPLEIEAHLMLHPDISIASVVGLSDKHYGEVVAAFLVGCEGRSPLTDMEIQEFVRSSLARHKTPKHIFWVGESGCLSVLPMTASGKIQKNKLRDWGNLKLTAHTRL
ncbi:acid Co-A ligase [Aureobasidium subglaciale]|nr:acid Co-A ligase [Aureobasidium subglaciale]KAI5213679.1 acid Co-A ligase [Aureobasidium subglaciale]KAI5215475.1 acid Co-A ligase [Aureobasidium subglaciale]KAI5253355.1 acid Co-A ligase [Aureobasidium subglaciale]